MFHKIVYFFRIKVKAVGEGSRGNGAMRLWLQEVEVTRHLRRNVNRVLYFYPYKLALPIIPNWVGVDLDPWMISVLAETLRRTLLLVWG